MFHVNLNHSSAQAKTMPPAKPSSLDVAEHVGVHAHRLGLGVAALVAPDRAEVGDPEPLGTPNSVITTA